MFVLFPHEPESIMRGMIQKVMVGAIERNDMVELVFWKDDFAWRA